MSTIYLAEDTILMGRQVALKELRLPSDASSDDQREAEAWFARESAILSTMHHPLIPVFYSVFREEGHSYIVQEYIPGENLEDVVSRHGPIAPAIVVSWGLALCELLKYFHNRPEPVVFRDLKPANILLRSSWSAPDRRLAVVDFGIARPFQGDAVGTVIGTPGYAPPEQYQGVATPQSDIYALGATLHRLLTGYDPEHGAPFSFPPARSLNPDVPAGLSNVIARATALNPADRYPSATAMGAWLAAYSPVTQSPARHANRSTAGAIDHSWLAVVAALIGALMLSPLLLFLASQPPDGFGGPGQQFYGTQESPYDGNWYAPPQINAPAPATTMGSPCVLITQSSSNISLNTACDPGSLAPPLEGQSSTIGTYAPSYGAVRAIRFPAQTLHHRW